MEMESSSVSESSEFLLSARVGMVMRFNAVSCPAHIAAAEVSTFLTRLVR